MRSETSQLKKFYTFIPSNINNVIKKLLSSISRLFCDGCPKWTSYSRSSRKGLMTWTVDLMTLTVDLMTWTVDLMTWTVDLMTLTNDLITLTVDRSGVDLIGPQSQLESDLCIMVLITVLFYMKNFKIYFVILLALEGATLGYNLFIILETIILYLQ